MRFLSEGGACGELIARRDWASTSLGPIAGWPASLRVMVATMLHTKQPMLLFWGPDLIQLYNDAFVPSFGVGKHPAAIGQPARECWREVWPVVGAQIEAVMARGEPAWYEDALVPILRNGRMEEVFWTYSYSPAYDDAGQIYGTLVIVTEMTARVLSQRRLASLSRLGTALAAASSPDAVLDALLALAASCPEDVPFLVARADDATRASGIAPEAICAEPPDDGVFALASPLPCATWPEAVTGAVAHRVDAHTRLVFGLSPRLPADAGYLSYLGQIAEQTASALARLEHARIREATQRQRDNLLRDAPVATAVLTGPHHVFELANPGYCRIVGRDPTGKAYLEAFPELRDTPLPGVLDHVYRTGEPFAVSEQLVPLADPATGVLADHFYNFNLEAMRDERQVVTGMMAIAVDVTEQVRARKALEEANRSKDAFLAMLGHELRNPLAPIASALELMAKKDTAAAIAREREVVARQLGHVMRLVDDLLDISRITRGTIELDRSAVDLREIVEASVEATQHLIRQRGHRLTIDVAPDLLVLADAPRLVQIVSNLLVNAAKYSPDGGEIRISIARRGDSAVLDVTDRGVGIDAELLPRVFDLFVQDRQSLDRAEGGLGIGLAIVKNLVTLHGGTVAVRSAGRGCGSTFTVELPLVLGTAATAPADGVPVAPPAAARRVLVVDDNVDAADMLGELIRAHGHDVAVSHDPLDALDLLGRWDAEVALLDIGLPGIDGYELATRMLALRPHCRLIALTGYGQETDRERTRDAGFTAHLVKPARLDRVLALLAH